MNNYKPPFQITEKMTVLIGEISEEIGRMSIFQEKISNPHLRRENRIKTIHSSLAIEHNSLSLEQVTAILDGKRVLGNPNEIKEVKNAYEAYELLTKLNPFSVKDLLNAHRLMMNELVKENGKFRSQGVSIFAGRKIVHIAPPADLVPKHISSLISWYKTSHSSLAIEHNSLSLEQVTAILDGKRVLGNPNEIKEVKNAYEAYELLTKLNPFSVKDLLNAHRLMMNELVKENGKFRSQGVSIFAGRKIVHIAPPADLVPKHISSLISWYKTSSVHPLIKSAVFHYEFEFIHPFSDGNGRIGRMWHTLLLGKWKKIFFWLPIEELIKKEQKEYYDTLAIADKEGESTIFVEFMLKIINDSLKEIKTSERITDQDNDQVTVQDSNHNKNPVEKLLSVLGDNVLSATEIMEKLNLVHKPTFRKNYLNPALEAKLIERTIPDKPNSKNQKYRKSEKIIKR